MKDANSRPVVHGLSSTTGLNSFVPKDVNPRPVVHGRSSAGLNSFAAKDFNPRPVVHGLDSTTSKDVIPKKNGPGLNSSSGATQHFDRKPMFAVPEPAKMIDSLARKTALAAKKSRKARQTYQHMANLVVINSQSNGFMDKGISLRAFLYHLFDSSVHSAVMGLIILTNAIMVIHETDLKASEMPVPKWLNTMDKTFLVIYLIEVLLRLYTFRWAFFQNRWNLLDLLVVITDITAEVIKLGADKDAPAVSLLRIFRLARLLRLIGMLSLFQELQTMLLGFGSAMKAMVWASFMICVVITVCSILAVEFINPLNKKVAETGAYGDCERCGRAFETVAESNLTFIQQIIAGDSWGMITIPIMEAYPVSGIFFLIVFALIDLGVLNLILTVIVNAAEQARQSNTEMQLTEKALVVDQMKHNLKSLCAALDTTGDGRISLEEFLLGVDENVEFAKALALLDVQKQDAEVIYNLMDEDGSGDVDYHEFVHTMISSQQETTNTKLLFLKANVNDLSKTLKMQHKFLQEHFSAKKGCPDTAEAVNKAINESSANLGLQSEKLMAEFQNLARKLDQRWEQLEQVVGNVLMHQPFPKNTLPSSELSSPAQSGMALRRPLLSTLPLPPAGAPGNTRRSHLFSGSLSPEPRVESKSPSDARYNDEHSRGRVSISRVPLPVASCSPTAPERYSRLRSDAGYII